MRPHHRLSVALMGMFLVVSLAGCGSAGWDGPRAAPPPRSLPSVTFVPASAPPPEATITPPVGSWESFRPASGYRVVLLAAGSEKTTQTLHDAVTEWADAEGVDLRVVAADPHDPRADIVHALGMHGDLIVAIGDHLIDPLAIISANHLDQQFLILGAQLAEPTGNVTAVDWEGAGFRGEGLGQTSTYDAATFTPERGAAAIRAGAAAVGVEMTGVVLRIG